MEEVHEDVVLDDAYAGDSCAFMLQYVLQDSDSYRIFVEADKLHTPAAQTPPRITNVSSARSIKETSQSQENSYQTSHSVWMLNHCLHQKAWKFQMELQTSLPLLK